MPTHRRRLPALPAFLATLTALAVLVFVAAACGTGEEDRAALSFTAAELSGGELDASTLQGTDVVLWFWAPWCTTCRAEAPNVVEVADAFDGEVEVIGVAGRGQVADMERFVEETGTGGFTHVVDGDGSIWSQFEVIDQPAFAFIGADGEVDDVHIGPLGAERLTERFTTLRDN